MRELSQPIALPPNAVGRFYRGGGRLAAFRAAADQPVDADACEDWVGSVTRTWQPPGAQSHDEGLSRLPDGTPLAEALSRTAAGVLVKLLDAGQRLPVHCHPDRAFARAHLASPFGKAEAWAILDAWEVDGQPPTLWLGWREGLARDELAAMIREQRTDEMLAAMARVPARVGDVWFVPAGVPHAIGAGVFMVEVQEPSDFSIVAEWRGFPIDPADAALRREWSEMVNAFDLEPMSAERLESLRQPAPASADPVQPLLPPQVERFFRAWRLRIDGTLAWPLPPAWTVVVVVGGTGMAHGAGRSLALRRGVTFGVPTQAAAHLQLEGQGLELIACQGGTQPPE